jgi:hypothetical protein
MAAEWYYTTNKQQMGPVSWDELRQLASRGLLKPNDLVWSEGMGEWAKAVRQSGLFPDAPGGTDRSSSGRLGKDEAIEPLPSKTRRRIDHELDALDADERRERRSKRKRGLSTGARIGIVVGAIVLVLLTLGCVVTAVLVMVIGANTNRTAPDEYRVSLGPNTDDVQRFRFQAGQRVTIQVRPEGAGGGAQPSLSLIVSGRGMTVRSETRNAPHCDATFTAPATDTYTVRVGNRGQAVAHLRVSVN